MIKLIELEEQVISEAMTSPNNKPKYTQAELKSAKFLDVKIPSYDGSHPISHSNSISKFNSDELRKVADNKSLRTDKFEKWLLGLWLSNDKAPVPYFFLTPDGSIRSLDAGCLGYLANREPPEIEFEPDSEGYISTVMPKQILFDRYERLGETHLKQLVQPSETGDLTSTASPSESDVDETLGFDPNEPLDDEAKKRSRRAIRDGAKQFRMDIIKHWNEECALSNCRVKAALDAAHIFRYGGKHTNDLRNGVLLRADLHRLFDRFLISIFYESGDLVFRIHPSLKCNDTYSVYDSVRISASDLPYPRPHAVVVNWHFGKFQEDLDKRS